MHIRLDHVWQHQMLPPESGSQTESDVVIKGKMSSYHLFGCLCQYRCTSNYALHSSLNLLWLYNGGCLQFECICSWHILTAQPHHLRSTNHFCPSAPTDVDSVPCELTASGEQQKGEHLVLLPFTVAGKLLEVNELSLQMHLLHTRFALRTAGSSKILADTSDQGDLSMCSKVQFNHTP